VSLASAQTVIGECPGCSIAPWQRYAYEVENGNETFGYLQDTCAFFTTTHGDPRYYICPGFLDPPAPADPKWGFEGLNPPGLGFQEPSRLPQTQCSLGPYVDTNWFQTFLFVPSSVAMNTVVFQFDVDDGARVQVYNSLFPNGSPITTNPPNVAGSYMYLNQNQISNNVASYMVSGEANRVVVTQIDDCIDQNGFDSALAIINGVIITNVTYPPLVTLNYGADPSIRLGDSTTLTINVRNNNSDDLLGATMLLDLDLEISAVAGTVVSSINPSSCPTLTVTSNQLAMASSTLLANTECSYVMTVQGVSPGGVATFVVIPTENSAPGVSNVDTLTVMRPPTVFKSFTPDSTDGAPVEMLIEITNGNGLPLLDAEFTDSLPSTVMGITSVSVTSSPPGGGTCPTVSIVSNELIMGPVDFPGNLVCSYRYSVTPTGSFSNQFDVTSSNADPGASNIAYLTYDGEPAVDLSYNVTTIPSDGFTTTTMTISITNTPGGPGNFNMSMPPGLLAVVGSEDSLTSGCETEVPTVAPDGLSVASPGPFNGSTTCLYTVEVYSSTPGPTLNGFTLNTTPEASVSNVPLYVVGAPNVTVAYAQSSIGAGDATTFTITIENPNAVSLEGVDFTTAFASLDLVSSGAISAGPGCPIADANAAGDVLSMIPGPISAGFTCVYTVIVNGPSPGRFTTSVSVTTTNSPAASTASDTLDVLLAPIVTKSFPSLTLADGDSTTLAIDVYNPNTISIEGLGFTDSLPPGYIGSPPPPPSSGCGTASLTGQLFEVSGASIPAMSFCNYTLTVTGSGSPLDTLNTVLVTSDNAPDATDDARLVIMAAPTVTPSFNPTNLAIGDSGRFIINIGNPNPENIDGASFTVLLPDGIDGASIFSSNCPSFMGTTIGDPPVLDFSGGDIPPSGCRFVFDYTTDPMGAGGTLTVPSFNVSSFNAPNGTAVPVSVELLQLPVLTKTYGATAIGLGLSTTLTIRVENNNILGLAGFSLVDTFPAGLTAVPPVPGGILAPTAEGGVCPQLLVELDRITVFDDPLTQDSTDNQLGANTNCTWELEVAAQDDARITTNVIDVTTTNAGAVTVTQVLNILDPPIVNKAYASSPINSGDTTTLTISIENSNAFASMEDVNFTDLLGSGLEIVGAVTNVPLIAGCSPVTSSSSSSLEMTSGVIPASTTCSYEVSVMATGTTWNQFTVYTGNAGTGQSPRVFLGITGDVPTVTKSYADSSIPIGASTTLTIDITNPGSARTDVSFNDLLPEGLEASGPSPVLRSPASGCPQVTHNTSNVIMLSPQPFAATRTCTYTIPVTAVGPAGLTLNSIIIPTTPSASDTDVSLEITDNVLIVRKGYARDSIPLLETNTTLTISVTNPTSIAVENAYFLDNLVPAGLQVSFPGVNVSASGICSDVVTTDTTIEFSGTIPPLAECVWVVEVTGVEAYRAVENSVTLTSQNFPDATGQDTIAVLSPPTATKTYAAGESMALGETTTLTIVVTNPNGWPIEQFEFIDSLPPQLVSVSPMTDLSSCGGTVNAISVTDATIPAMSSCTYVVDVQGIATGETLNSITFESINAPDGNVTDVLLYIMPPPVATLTFSEECIAEGQLSDLNMTFTNVAAFPVEGLTFVNPMDPSVIIANVISDDCGATAVLGSSTIFGSGITLAANESCSIVVTVNGTSGGDRSIQPFFASTTNAGFISTTVTPFYVMDAPIVSVSLPTLSMGIGLETTYTIVLQNPNGFRDQENVIFDAPIPGNFSIESVSTVGSCTPATNSSNNIEFNSTLSAGGVCVINVLLRAIDVSNVEVTFPSFDVSSSGNDGACASPTAASASLSMFILAASGALLADTVKLLVVFPAPAPTTVTM